MDRYRVNRRINSVLRFLGAIPAKPSEAPPIDEPPRRTKADLVLEEVGELRSHIRGLEAKVLSALTNDTDVISDRIALLDKRVDELGAGLRSLSTEMNQTAVRRESITHLNVPHRWRAGLGESDEQMWSHFRGVAEWVQEGLRSYVESTIPMEPLDPVNLTDANLTDVGDERLVRPKIAIVGGGRFVGARTGAVVGETRADPAPMTTSPAPRHVDAHSPGNGEVAHRRTRRRRAL